MVNQEDIKKAKSIKIDKSKGSMYNSWRSKIYTKKGRLAGFPYSWITFKQFKLEMSNGWKKGFILCRKNTKLPYSKQNCYWAPKGNEVDSKLVKLTYNHETKTLVEWCNEYQLNYSGVRQRYFKGINFTPGQILFGKYYLTKKEITDIRKIDDEQLKRNKVSKMLSAYRCKDKKHGWITNITNEYLRDVIENGKCFYCGDTHNLGLDRIDNSRGHEIGNVVPCCYECNVARGNNFTMEEMRLIGKTIKEIKKKRNESKIKEIV